MKRCLLSNVERGQVVVVVVVSDPRGFDVLPGRVLCRGSFQ